MSAPRQFCPVALTSLVMKTQEKIVKSFILSAVQPMLDPLQFAYSAGRGIEDAKLFLLDKLYLSTWSCCIFMLRSSLLTSLLCFAT